MSPAAFLDTNVAIYATGRVHILKRPCAEVLALVGQQPDSFLTSVEVFQELLHRSISLRQWEARGREVFQDFAELMSGRVEPIYPVDVARAAELATLHPRLGARDLLHTAVMKRLDMKYIVSADRGFDQVVEIERLDPADVESWRELVLA